MLQMPIYSIAIPFSGAKQCEQLYIESIIFAHTFIPNYSPIDATFIPATDETVEFKLRRRYFSNQIQKINSYVVFLIFNNEHDDNDDVLNDIIANGVDGKVIVGIKDFEKFYEHFIVNKDLRDYVSPENIMETFVEYVSGEIEANDIIYRLVEDDY